jgi:hypothetical protein
MEFVPGPAVHRVLCADCGSFLSLFCYNTFDIEIRYTDYPKLCKLMCCLPPKYVSLKLKQMYIANGTTGLI